MLCCIQLFPIQNDIHLSLIKKNINYCKHKADQTISEKGGKDGPSMTHLIHSQEHGIHLNRHTTIMNMRI